MLIPRGMLTLDNKEPIRDREALFDCASRRTQGSSAKTVHEAAIGGSFLFCAVFSYTAFLTYAMCLSYVFFFTLCVVDHR